MGQAQPKHKGKISRVLAAKCALSVRVDALGDTQDATIGYESRLKVEERMRQLEGKAPQSREEASASAKQKQPPLQMYASGDASRGYSAAADSTLAAPTPGSKRKAEGGEEDEDKAAKKARKAEKAAKKAAKLAKAAAAGGADDEAGEKKKKKKKDKGDDGERSAKKAKKAAA